MIWAINCFSSSMSLLPSNSPPPLLAPFDISHQRSQHSCGARNMKADGIRTVNTWRMRGVCIWPTTQSYLIFPPIPQLPTVSCMGLYSFHPFYWRSWCSPSARRGAAACWEVQRQGLYEAAPLVITISIRAQEEGIGNTQGVTFFIKIEELAFNGRCNSGCHQKICPSQDWKVYIALGICVVGNENLVLILQWFGRFNVYNRLDIVVNLDGLVARDSLDLWAWRSPDARRSRGAWRSWVARQCLSRIIWPASSKRAGWPVEYRAYRIVKWLTSKPVLSALTIARGMLSVNRRSVVTCRVTWTEMENSEKVLNWIIWD